MSRHTRSECTHTRLKLLGTGPNVLELVVIRIPHSLIGIVESPICVKGVAEWGGDRLWTKAMSLLTLTRSSAVSFVTGSSAVNWSDTKRSGRSLKGSGINRRHPNSSFVDLEEIGHQVVKVDVIIGEVVKRELLAVP